MSAARTAACASTRKITSSATGAVAVVDQRRRMWVFVLEFTDPQGEGYRRVFRDRAKAIRAARRWTGTICVDASDSWWRGRDGRENYDADVYRVRVE